MKVKKTVNRKKFQESTLSNTPKLVVMATKALKNLEAVEKKIEKHIVRKTTSKGAIKPVNKKAVKTSKKKDALYEHIALLDEAMDRYARVDLSNSICTGVGTLIIGLGLGSAVTGVFYPHLWDSLRTYLI